MKTSNIPKIDLNDLVPDSTVLITNLTQKKGIAPIELNPFDLNAQIWLAKKYKTDADIKELFTSRDVERISELGYFLVKDKELYPTIESFRACIGGATDSFLLMQAILRCIGLSQPQIKSLASPEVPKMQAPNRAQKRRKQTGRKSTT